MKTLILAMVFAIGGLSASAQVKANLNINIGAQPVWGPTGYDHAEYYYLPEYDIYYDVPHRKYIYNEGGHWTRVSHLPSRYHDVDLYRSYKVVMNEPKPYMHHDENRRKYEDYRSRHDQPVIRDSHEEKYWEIKDHPEHNKWHGHDHDQDRH
jgi:hypothetical protein